MSQTRTPVTFGTCSAVRGPFFHGTSAQLAADDELVLGHESHFQAGRVLHHLYFSALVWPAAWGAELATALGGHEGRGHVYRVEPQGPFEDDPNVTDKKFPGNLTESYRTRDPLRVVEELVDWVGHTPAEIQAMLDGLARLRAEGRDVILD